jgi:hypothetical protein
MTASTEECDMIDGLGMQGIQSQQAPIGSGFLSRLENGVVQYQNDYYMVGISPLGSASVTNLSTGNSYDFTQNLFVNVDNKREFRFVGDLEIGFQSELRLIFDTVPSPSDQFIAQLDAVVIVDGNYSARISGMNQPGNQDLSVQQQFAGNAITDDAFVPPEAVISITESESGGGFVATDVDGNQTDVDQSYIDENDQQRMAQLFEFARRVHYAFGESFVVSLLTSAYSNMIANSLDQKAQSEPGNDAAARYRTALEQIPPQIRFSVRH